MVEIDGMLDLRGLRELMGAPVPGGRYPPFEGRNPWPSTPISGACSASGTPGPPPVRALRRHHRAVLLRRGGGPGRRGHPAHALPDRRALPDRGRADAGARARRRRWPSSSSSRPGSTRRGTSDGCEGWRRRAPRWSTAWSVSRTTRKWGWCSAGRTTGSATTRTSAPATTTRPPPRSIPTSRSSPPTAELGADLHDLFNQLTGSSRGPTGTFRRIAVAPDALLPWLLESIERETRARLAGGPAGSGRRSTGSPTTKSCRRSTAPRGRASTIELVVRGLCVLRPGVPEHSERIRVVSRLGRFLEHARIYHFANGGEERYLIGSADWRPRNLRRRVEVVTPVTDADGRATLDGILTRELTEPDGGSSTPTAATPVWSRADWLEKLLAAVAVKWPQNLYLPCDPRSFPRP